MSLYNPSYAARPNNMGLTLIRYAGHADLDLVGRRLSIPVDVNMFTDRLRDSVAKLAPSELDVIAGLTSTWRRGPGALELGARYENDRQLSRQPADQRPPTPNPTSQQYVDLRARYLYSFADASSRFHERSLRSDVSGWLTLGWFAYNPSYYARPNNPGLALFRYAVHTEVSLLNDLVCVGVDATTFTDRKAPNPARPSELDITPELIFRKAAYQLHLAFEIDTPLDESGLTQKYFYVLGVRRFDLWQQPAPAARDAEPIPSP